MTSATGPTRIGAECPTPRAKTGRAEPNGKAAGRRFEVGMMELPKGTISVRNLAYLASMENDQSSEKAEYVRCATWVIHVACLLFSVFSKVLGRASIGTSM